MKFHCIHRRNVLTFLLIFFWIKNDSDMNEILYFETEILKYLNKMNQVWMSNGYFLSILSVLIFFLYFVISERYSLLPFFSETIRFFNFKINLSFLSAGKKKSASSSKIVFDKFISVSKWPGPLFLWVFKCFFKPNTDLNSWLHCKHLYRCFSCSVLMCVFRLLVLLNVFKQIWHDTIR